MAIERLTPGEALWVWMRRMGVKRKDVARHFHANCGVRTVTDWLCDRKAEDGMCPDVGVIGLWEREHIAVARRRMGWSVGEMANKLGISHVTMTRREHGRGEVDWIVAWWDERGWPTTQYVPPNGMAAPRRITTYDDSVPAPPLGW